VFTVKRGLIDTLWIT